MVITRSCVQLSVRLLDLVASMTVCGNLGPTIKINSAFYPSRMSKSKYQSNLHSCVKVGEFTCVGVTTITWQVRYSDLIWQVTLHSSDDSSWKELRILTLPYFRGGQALTPAQR